QPNHVLSAKVVAKDLIVFFASHARIAALSLLVEEAFLGGEQGAAAIDVNAAALERHHPAFAAGSLDGKHAQLASLGNAWGEAVVFLPVRVFCPRGELELGDGHLGLRAGLAHTNRPEVARPTAIAGRAKELDVG